MNATHLPVFAYVFAGSLFALPCLIAWALSLTPAQEARLFRSVRNLFAR